MRAGRVVGRLAGLDPRERRRLGGLGVAVLALHVLGWGLFLLYVRRDPALGGLGLLAYTFGLRHAFDADHIAAIDNTTRKLLRQGERPLGVGFFFSLGHSTIVLGLAAGLAAAAATVSAHLPLLQGYGGTVGTAVSGAFLWLIGILNLVVLVDILRISSQLRRGALDEERLERRLLERGFANRLLGRLGRLVSRSWHVYPVGVLFGLGFDTATEIGLLALAAGVATHAVPFAAVLSLPILFAAGMSLMDTADGVFMAYAYDWAFASPVRRVFYNVTVSALSVLVALAIGSVELLQVLSARLGPWPAVSGIDLGHVGYLVVGLFVATWTVAAVVWRKGRIEERWRVGVSPASGRGKVG